MNKRHQVLWAIALIVVMPLLVSFTRWAVQVEDAAARERCWQDCQALDYMHDGLNRYGLGYRCRCWNDGMDTRYNPWGRQ